MAKIPLTISGDYIQDWGFWEGCRELIQNAKDADEYEGAKMTVKHFAQTNKLVITNENTVVPASLLLLLGATSKRETEQRGKFGEGAVLGILALIRAGHDVRIESGGEVWTPAIEEVEEGHPFAGSKLLVFNTRKLRDRREDFTVEIDNVSKEVWAATKKLFLFLQPPKAADMVEVPGEGSVLLGEDYKGMVFSRGIFVMKHDDIECGYDLRNLKLDRDRRSTDEWDLRYHLSQIWNQAHCAAPDKFAAVIYKMAKEDKAETKSLRYSADQKLLSRLKEEFEAEHGKDTVPVETMSEARELEELGAKTAVVNRTLRELLEKTGPKPDDVKQKLKGQVKKTWNWSELSNVVKGAVNVAVERVTKEYLVVDFTDPKLACKFLEKEQKVGIALSFLETATPRDIIWLVAREEAKHVGKETELVLLDVIMAGVRATAPKNGHSKTPEAAPNHLAVDEDSTEVPFRGTRFE